MSSGQQPQQSSSSTWTEPPWCGWIETTGDALLILEAARRGLIPRVTRRLVDAERKMITSGSVFVFDEDESGIKRWTDGFFWSPSRILGNFLLYRETDKRGAGHRSIKADQELNSEDTLSLSRPRSDSASLAVDKHRERSLVGSLTNSYKFKPEGLVKKTFSLSIEGVAQHLISYYKIEDVENGRLRSPSSLPELASLDISPQYLDKTHFRNPPKVETGVDGIPRYCGEADDLDTPSTPSSTLTGPLSSSSLPPLLTEGRVAENSSTKRGKRYDPYNPPGFKRPRKNTKSSHQDPTSPTTEGTASPVASTSSPSAQATQPPSPPPHTGLPEPSAPVIVPMPAAIPHGYSYGMPTFYSGYPPPPPGHVYGHPNSTTMPQPGVGIGVPPYPPPPAVAPVTSTTYAYPGYPPVSAGPLTSANLAPTSSTTATTTVTTTTQLRGSDLSQAGPGPSLSSHHGLAPAASAHSGQGYTQTQPHYYSYYPPPSHLQHSYSHTPVTYQWHQYSAYGHPPPGPHHPQASSHAAQVQSQQHIGMARDIHPRNEEGNIEQADSL